MRSGKTAAKQAKNIVNASVQLGSALYAIKHPEIRAVVASIAVITVLFLVGAPNLSVSVLRCGFQWGTISKMK